MKTSNILIIGLLGFLLSTLIGFNLVLKAEFDKIDRKNPFYGYKQESLDDFKFLKVIGADFGVTQIERGGDSHISYNIDRNMLNWKFIGDTLALTFTQAQPVQPNIYQLFDDRPSVYIVTPTLNGLQAVNATNILKNWKNTDFKLTAIESACLLTDNNIKNLDASLSRGALLKIDHNNSVMSSKISVKDSSSLNAEKNVFKVFDVQADSLANIKVPGSLYKK